MQLFLGTGLALGRLRRSPPSGPGAPALLRPPALVGTGRIGAPLGVDPGDWTGAARLALAWLKDGAPIPGATGPDYAPGAADDRAVLACRVTAFGAGGRTAAETPPITIAFPQPLLVGPLPDLDYMQGTGPHIVDISPFFSGNSLSFSVTGDGVAVDPATGLVTVSAAALLSGVSVSVTATNSGGAAATRFRLTVTAASIHVPPVFVVAPTLAGDGRVGAELVVDPGVWEGDPTPELALQWLADGAPIDGATGVRFTPGAAQDGASVACRVTASNAAGTATAETAAVIVTQAPPAVVGALADVTLALDGGGLALPAAGAFAGAALRFAVAGAGASVDPATGVVAIPAGTRRSAETVTVTATNSGGAASVRFAVTVLAAPVALAAPAPVVFAQGSGPKTVAAAAFFSGDDLAYALDGAPGGVTINADSGRVTIPTAAALEGGVTVRAVNALGAASVRFAVTVLAAPVALAAPAPVVFAQGSGSKTVAAAAFFAGDDLAFALDGAPVGVTINAGSGLIAIPTGAALEASLTVRATNLAGAATQRFAVTVLAAPVALAAPAPVVFAQGSGSKTVAAAAFFAGDDLAFALDGAPVGVTINAGSGLIAIPTGAALEASLTVRATNLAGAATQRLAVTVLAAPVALAAPAPVVFAQGSGSKTVAAAAFFSGDDLAFALDGAPAGVTINAGSGLIAIPTGAALEASLTVRATNLAGAATQRLTVSVRAGVAPMTNTAPPTFAPRAAPGTTVGSVWDIGDGTWTGGLAPFTTERGVFRGAVQTVPYGAAASYTILGADRTAVQNVVTARVRRTDSSTPPQVVTVVATGQAVIPPIATGGGADYTVSNTAQLLAAMIDSCKTTAAQLIVLQPGNYDNDAFSRNAALVKPGARTVIRAANRNEGTAAANPRSRFLNGESNIVRLNNFTFDGIVWESTTKDANGYPATTAKALNWNDATNVTFRNCTFMGQHRSLAFHDSVNLTIEWCEHTRCGMDSISCYGTHIGLQYLNNLFHDTDIHAARAHEDVRHPDASSMQGTSGRDIVWRGNSYFGAPGVYWQGIFCANSTVVNGGDFNANCHDGVTIEKNWIVASNFNALFVAGTRNLICQDNVIRRNGGGPKLVFTKRVEGVVRRNVLDAAIEYQKGASASMLTLEGNVISPTATPAALPRPEPCGPYAYE